ncbi:MAG: hypothetical protein QOJ38_1692 [Solirubrobacterales bacterium]|jgi:hypothetical protein|nr:hypothetical protein [Solirubrobacterales bacterium]
MKTSPLTRKQQRYLTIAVWTMTAAIGIGVMVWNWPSPLLFALPLVTGLGALHSIERWNAGTPFGRHSRRRAAGAP